MKLYYVCQLQNKGSGWKQNYWTKEVTPDGNSNPLEQMKKTKKWEIRLI